MSAPPSGQPLSRSPPAPRTPRPASPLRRSSAVATRLPNMHALSVTEYQWLRDESAQARQAQHTILQWSLGALAVVFAAAVAFKETNLLTFRLIYGLGLPLFGVGASFAWFGELIGLAVPRLRGRPRPWQRGQTSLRPRRGGPRLRLPAADLGSTAPRSSFNRLMTGGGRLPEEQSDPIPRTPLAERMTRPRRPQSEGPGCP